jgi:hypothetical protein
MGVKRGLPYKGRIEIEDFWEQGAKENIWT